jgi:predicted nucleic acid-binding protein
MAPVTAWFRGVSEDRLFLSAVTLGELQSGIERTRLQDPAKAEEIENWVDQLMISYQVLPMDAACFREWGPVNERQV